MNDIVLKSIKSENIKDIKKKITEWVEPNIKHECIIFAIKNCKKISTIKYINKYMESKYDINSKSEQLLEIACYYSLNLEIIKYFEKMNKGKKFEELYGEDFLLKIFLENINLITIKYLINEKKMDINKTTKSNDNCLTLACKKQNFEAIKYLINETDIDTNIKNNSNENALLICFKQSVLNYEIIKFLITRTRIDINITDKDGYNCLFYACSNGTIEIVKLLIKYNININHKLEDNSNCLIHAFRYSNNLEVIKYLINSEKIYAYATTCHNNDGLIFACYENQKLEKIKYLINELNFSVNKTNNFGRNALLECFNGKTKLNHENIKYLITETDVDINIIDENKYNCLLYACSKKDITLEIIKLIVEKNVNLYATTKDGDNCLLLACKYVNNIEIIKYFIEEKKMNIYIQNNQKNNCMLFACCNQNLEIIKYLVEEKNMDLGYKNIINTNCLLMACEYNKNIKIIEYLIENSEINIYDTNSNDENCLMILARANGEIEFFDYLIEKQKMSLTEQNINGKNALYYAAEYIKCSKTLKYLIEKSGIDINSYTDTTLLFFDRIYKSGNYHVIEHLIRENIISIARIEPNRLKSITNNEILLNEIIRLDIDLKNFLVNFNYSEQKNLLNAAKYHHDYWLSIICQYCNLEFMEYLINELKLNYNYRNEKGEDLLMLALSKNTKIDIIKFLVEKMNIDMELEQKDYLKYVYENPNFEIVKYVFEKNKFTKVNIDKICEKNKNPEIICYAIENYSLDKDYVQAMKIILEKNVSLEIIKYLVENNKVDIRDKIYNNCLKSIFEVSNDLQLIRYLVKKSDYKIEKFDKSFLHLISKKTDKNIAKFYIEELKININYFSISQMSSEFYSVFREGYISFYENGIVCQNVEFAKIIKKKTYSPSEIEIIYDYIMEKNLKGDILTNKDFYDNLSYEKLVNLCLQGIKIHLTIQEYIDDKIVFSNIFLKNKLEKIFTINNIDYYGIFSDVISMSPMIKKIYDIKMADYNNITIDMPEVSKNTIVVYLNICHFKTVIVLGDLNIDELIEFYYFHDKYPISIINDNILDSYFYTKLKNINSIETEKYHELLEICKIREFPYLLSKLSSIYYY